MNGRTCYWLTSFTVETWTFGCCLADRCGKNFEEWKRKKSSLLDLVIIFNLQFYISTACTRRKTYHSTPMLEPGAKLAYEVTNPDPIYPPHVAILLVQRNHCIWYDWGCLRVENNLQIGGIPVSEGAYSQDKTPKQDGGVCTMAHWVMRWVRCRTPLWGMQPLIFISALWQGKLQLHSPTSVRCSSGTSRFWHSLICRVGSRVRMSSGGCT